MKQELITIESISTNAISVFTGENDALEAIILQIEKEALSLVPDVSTQKGRDAIRSNAANVAKAKVRIDDAGKALTAELKELPKKVDASRKAARDRLDNLRDTVRQPLTDWENEQARIEAERKEAERLAAEKAEAERLFLLDWDQAILENERFDLEKEKAALRAEQEAIEAKRLADEKAESDRLAIIKAEKDKEEREAKIKQEAIETEQARQKAAQEKAEADKLAAEKMAELAIENARLAKLAAIQEAAELAAKVEADRAKAIEVARFSQELADKRAEESRLLAIENERKRIEYEAAKQKAIDDKKAADLNHRKAVNNEILSALVNAGISHDDAVKVIKLAANKMLGNLNINY